MNCLKTLPLLAFLFVSCIKSDCTNTNPVFEANLPQSQEYITELAKRLEKADKTTLSYVFSNYEVVNGQDFMNVDAEGDSLCATAHIKVTTWDDKLALIKQSKGKGYSGAQLTNLQIEISKDTTGTVLIYKSVDAVTD